MTYKGKIFESNILKGEVIFTDWSRRQINGRPIESNIYYPNSLRRYKWK